MGKQRFSALLLTMLLLLILTACGGGGGGGGKNPAPGGGPENGAGGGGGGSGGGGQQVMSDQQYRQLFEQVFPSGLPLAADSFFNQPIPPGAVVDPDSDLLIQSLVEDATEMGFVISQRLWTQPVYFADSSTPRYDITLTAEWAPFLTLKEVPIPEGAMPDSESDGHLIIVEQESRCVYEFWQARKTGNSWSASWGNAISADSNGIYPKGLSVRGSGFVTLAGLIWPWELAEGEIRHKLAFSYDYTRAGGPVFPATESDGWSDRPDAIPEGAVVQLDPSLDLDSLDLTPIERTIARALQNYGMVLVDGGGGIQLYLANPLAAGKSHWESLPDVDWIDLSGIPVDRFRVLKLPSQYEPDLEVVDTGCNQFANPNPNPQ